MRAQVSKTAGGRMAGRYSGAAALGRRVTFGRAAERERERDREIERQRDQFLRRDR